MAGQIQKLTLYLCIILIAGCTNPRWIVSDRRAKDPDDYEKLSSEKFLSPVSPVNSENPVLKLQLLNKIEYRYAEKILIQRHVQDYKINPLMFSLGLVGAGISFYSANSSSIINSDTKIKRFALNASGGLFTVITALSLQPEGEPRPTGEKRFLRQTGSILNTDTLQVEQVNADTAMVTLTYGDSTLIDSVEQEFRNGLLEINIAEPLDNLKITGSTIDSTHVAVAYNDSLYHFDFPLTSILQPFAEVIAPVTELRNEPNRSVENILAELVEGSQLPIVEEVGKEWYKVLYGISENYILKGDVQKVWRSSGTSPQNRVVAVPTVPFGDVDVENNIPVLSGENPDGVGLIITNENYGDRLPRRKYAIRDGRLIHSYLQNALGYPGDQIFHINDFRDSTTVYSAVDSIRSIASQNTDLVVFLSGFNTIERKKSRYSFKMLPGGSREVAESALQLNHLFDQIDSLPSDLTLVLGDLDFTHEMQNSEVLQSVTPFERPLRELAAIITENDSHSAVLFGSQLDQDTGLYFQPNSEDKRHHIFPYFVAKAIQDRNTMVSAIYNYLERNVSYISRKLHDRSQDPVLIGETSVNLVEEE